MKTSRKFTSWGKQTISSIKDVLPIGIMIIAIILLICAVASHYGKQFNQDNVGRQVLIQWEEVNLRESCDTSKKVITTLRKGSTVTLTGNYYECLIGDGLPTDSWTEVQLDNGTIGWIVTTSIKWT